MDGPVTGEFFSVFDDLALEIGPNLGYFLKPQRVAVLREVELQLLDAVDHLAQHELGIADQRNFSGYLPSDSIRRRIDLDVLGFVVPGFGTPEMLPAPEAEAERQHHVGTPGEWLLKCSANRKRMLFGHRALAGAPRVYRDGREFDEFAQFGSRLRPEQPVAAGYQRSFGRYQQFERAIDLRRIARRANVVNRKASAARALYLVVVVMVENILRDLD